MSDTPTAPHAGRPFEQHVPPGRPGRRRLLRAAAILGGAGGASAITAGTSNAATCPPGRGDQPTFVLVHGANGNAASFAPLVAALSEAGHRALAVDLPGHGPDGNFPASYQAPQDLAAFAAAPSPVLARTTLADNVRHVVATVRSAARHGPVILVGHSMGGATITRVGDEVPHLIARLVYLSAFCCVRLRSVIDCFQTPQASTTLLPLIPSIPTPERLGVSRTNWRSADPGFLAAAKAALAAEYDDASFLAALNTFEPDESTTVVTDDARGTPAAWGRIPRTYVRYTRDRAIPLALQNRMIKEADEATPGNRFEVRSLAAPHLGPKDPQPLAAVLTNLL
ncbi:alpha/beta hydrolase [Actinomadura miaoliensis]|uniref:Alpha/beta hydrolase n=1 Tax=Actinomadura miaoliensis TaxID=430685 RepID=A0ABP7V070_9ACTN